MNPDGDALLRAYEAFTQQESDARWQVFLSIVENVSERTGISEEAIIRAVRTRLVRQQRGEDKKPPAIPPNA